MKRLSHNQKQLSKISHRIKRRAEVENLIMGALKKEDDLTIAQLVEKTGLSRGNAKHYLKNLMKRKFVIGKRQNDIHGRPTFLRLNKKEIEKRQKQSFRSFEDFETHHLKSIVTMKILDEVSNQQDPQVQTKKILQLFKKFRLESFGEKLTFLMYSDYIKLNYEFELTEKGKKYLKKTKQKSSA